MTFIDVLEQMAAAIFGAFIVYLLFAFIMWTPNPEAWSMSARVFCAVFVVLAGVLASAITRENQQI